MSFKDIWEFVNEIKSTGVPVILAIIGVVLFVYSISDGKIILIGSFAGKELEKPRSAAPKNFFSTGQGRSGVAGIIFVIVAIILFIIPTNSQPSPTPTSFTITPTATSSVSVTKTFTLTLTNTVTSTLTPSPSTSLTLQRNADTIVIYLGQAVELKRLEVHVGDNEKYPLDTIFSVGTASAGSDWCLRNPDATSVMPSMCSSEKTASISNAGDWQNLPIKLLLDDKPVITCQAQPFTRSLYC